MAENIHDEESIFLAALQKSSPEERASYVDAACAGRSELHRRVVELLKSHEESQGPFDVPLPAVAKTIDMPVESPIDEAPGTVIGPYKLLQQIGEGGMGVVYMAEQAAPVRRKVALKIIKPGMDTREVIVRFEAERQALALMDHPNIAKVFDGGTTGEKDEGRRMKDEKAASSPLDSSFILQPSAFRSGRPYFVMELVRGVPITDYCDQNNLSVHERLELFVTVCHAVQHAHQKGIIHRDIKPSNVLVTLHDARPVPKVIDFGVAKAIGQQLTDKTLFTQFAQMVGTPLYMSPEQAQLTGLDVDTRGDIYSLGVLLYELLTGTTPFERVRIKQAALDEIRRIIREEDPPSPSTRLSTTAGQTQTAVASRRHIDPKGLTRLLRGDLDWIVMKALEKDRTRRYETADSFAADIVRYLIDEPVEACPPSSAYRFRKFARRNKRILATMSVITLALVVGTAVSMWQAIRATQAEGLAEARLEISNANQLIAEKSENQATHRLYDARLAQAQAGSLSRRVGQRFVSLEALADAAKIAQDLKLPEERFLEVRNAAIACLALPDLHLAKQWPGFPAGSASVDFDDNLEHYARADRQGAVSIRRVAGDEDEEIARLPETGSDTWPVFSRDGKFLSTWSAASLKVWKLGGREPIELLSEQGVQASDFSRDSRQFAISDANGSIGVYDLASGRPPRKLTGGRPATGLAFHPEGRQVAVSCGTSVEIRDLDTGKVVAELRHHPVTALDLAWHPEGRTLAVVGSDSQIHLWDVATGKPTLVLEGLRNSGIKIAFNHSGELLASAGWDGMLRLWDPHTGKQLFSTQSGIPGTPRFSRDDRLLSGDLRDGKLGLWEVTMSSEYRTLARSPTAGKDIYQISTIHSDGRWLAVSMQNGVGLWDLPSGKELAFIKSPQRTSANFALFESSGALLINDSVGLSRWPLQLKPGLLRIGSPQRRTVPGPVCHIASSPDGLVIALSQYQGGRVLHADRPDQPVLLGPHEDARYVAVSRDGKTVATGSQTRTDVKIWDALSGKLLKVLPADGSLVGFSPDGKWLATTGGGLRLWTVGSWQPGPRIGGNCFAFCPDGKLLAVDTGFGAVRLVDPDTGREYARLEDPNQDRSFWMSFSPDGSQLVTTNNDSQSIHVWDLRTIRNQLAKMDLDWDLPSYPPPNPDEGQRLHVQVDLGDLPAMIQAQEYLQQAASYLNSGQWDQAIGAYTQAIEFDPKNLLALSNRAICQTELGRFSEALADHEQALDAHPASASAHNNMAWWLATCPEPTLRDPRRAVELANRAVELAPQDGTLWNTLGVAQFRAGDPQAARDSLQKSIDLRQGGDAFDYFFLGMAHWQLGHNDEARTWYEKGVQWIEKNRDVLDKDKQHGEELKRFRAEAEELLK